MDWRQEFVAIFALTLVSNTSRVDKRGGVKLGETGSAGLGVRMEIMSVGNSVLNRGEVGSVLFNSSSDLQEETNNRKIRNPNKLMTPYRIFAILSSKINLTDGAQRPGGDGEVEKTDWESKLLFSAPFQAGGARSAAAGVRCNS